MRILCFFLVGLTACVQTTKHAVETVDPGPTYYAKQDFFTGFFFDDDRYGLISTIPLKKITVLKDLAGRYVLPKPIKEPVIKGTRVNVQKIEWPTPENRLKRPLLTPRHLVWIYLTVALDRGEYVTVNRKRTYIFLAPERIQDDAALREWFFQYFSSKAL